MRLETERGRRLDRAFGHAADRLDARDRAFVHELTYGVTRLRGRIDHLLARHVRRGLQRADATVREALRLGAYQLLYMGSVPDYAAVSETVEMVRADLGAERAGFVNAVLRKVAASGDDKENFPSAAEHLVAFLSTWGSHPGWLIDRWLQLWDPDQVRRLVEVNNSRPQVNLTPLSVNPSEAVRLLAEDGIVAFEVGAGTDSVRLGRGSRAADALDVLPGAIVQDPGANLVSRYTDVSLGTIVADLCAAPGGKVLALADRPAGVLAVDRSESRIHMVRENARRTGRRVGLVVADALRPPVSEVDAVLLDVPCTGTGTLARNPDARWRLRPESIDDLARLQRRMLESAASVVAPGGLLVYSTCTLEPEENEACIDAFLNARTDFEMDASDAIPEHFRDSEGRLYVRPQDTGFDGAFAARMRRIG